MEVRQLLEGSDEASLILKIDTKPLVHWIEPVAKLHTHRTPHVTSDYPLPYATFPPSGGEARLVNLAHHAEDKNELIVGSNAVPRATVK